MLRNVLFRIWIPPRRICTITVFTTIISEHKSTFKESDIQRTVHPDIFLMIKANKTHCFSTLFGKELYMFRTDLLYIIRSLNTVLKAVGICHNSYVDCLLTRLGWNTYLLLWIQYRDSWWWTVNLSETCRVLYQIMLRNSASRWILLLEHLRKSVQNK
jgi:hypothetical protein